MRFNDFELISSLININIFRIKHELEFLDHKHVNCITTIAFENIGEKPLIIAPADIYEKNILVKYSTTNIANETCISVPADENDRIIIKYIFYLLWNSINKTDGEIKKWLLSGFLGDTTLDINTPIEEIINHEFAGELYKYFYQAMWTPEEPSRNLSNFIDHILKGRNKKLFNRDCPQPFNIPEELKNFILYLDTHFIQLVYITESTANSKYLEIYSSTTLVCKPRKIIPSSYFRVHHTFWLNPILPCKRYLFIIRKIYYQPDFLIYFIKTINKIVIFLNN